MKRLWLILLVCALLWPAGLTPSQTTYAQSDNGSYLAEAQALLAGMTPVERVGQLFVITFRGSQIQEGSPLYELVTTTGLGGVVLLSENDNFTASDDLPGQIIALSNTLQELTLTGSSSGAIAPAATVTPTLTPAPDPLTGRENFIPLFIGSYHGGDGLHELLTGVTELPSPMAIGATWSPDRAGLVGRVAGRELGALGINLVLGPSLSVLNSPPVFTSNGIGARTFGGSPYWVGQLGQAYVAGLHGGSRGRLAVIATGFPGSGSSDRPLDLEISTIRKSLDELRQNELLPYFIAANGEESAQQVDGFMTAHLRYEGFQGNIRPTSPPVSFDPQALNTLLNDPSLRTWRTSGGIVMSPPLGAPAVQRFFNATSTEFPHRQVAKDALLAGNDLLFIDDFGPLDSSPLSQLSNIQDTINWFVERYQTDPAFSQRVDEAALRILQTKLRIYGGDFGLENTLVDRAAAAAQLEDGQGAVFTLAQESVTLLAPSPEELALRLPSAPTADDRIIIFSDTRADRQCESCPPRPRITTGEIEERMVTLYGPSASGEVRREQITSFALDDLIRFLETPFSSFREEEESTFTPTPTPESTEEPIPLIRPTPAPVERQVFDALTEGDWVIFALQEIDPGSPSAAFKRLLIERPELLRGKIVIGLSFAPPFYLDATEISQLSAYYGLYGTGSSFVDAAVRAIFRDLTPPGASPITIEGLAYDISEVTQPTPQQTIELFLLDGSGEPLSLGPDPLSLQPGQTLKLQTGLILDRNGNPVPDGTQVRFSQEDRVSGFFDVIGEEETVDGIATFDYVLENRPGQFRLRVAAGSANRSQEIDIAIGENLDASISLLTPTPEPTPTPTATPTATPTPLPTPTPEPTPTSTPMPAVEELEPQLNILLSEMQQLFALFGGLALVLFVGSRGSQPPTGRLRQMIWGVIGGLCGYLYFTFGLPGVDALPLSGPWLALLLTLVLGTAGLLTAVLYHRVNGDS